MSKSLGRVIKYHDVSQYALSTVVHQSAKDYLCDVSRGTLVTSLQETNHHMFCQSVRLMSVSLKRDMYSLSHPGYPIEDVETPVNDPLATVRYSCIFWVDHFDDSMVVQGERKELESKDAKIVYDFIKQYYLYWLETLSLCRSIPVGIRSMRKLELLLRVSGCAPFV